MFTLGLEIMLVHLTSSKAPKGFNDMLNNHMILLFIGRKSTIETPGKIKYV